jgi:hypothetical protein
MHELQSDFTDINAPPEQSGMDISHVQKEIGNDTSLEEKKILTNDLINVYPEEGFPDIKKIFRLDVKDESFQSRNLALERAFDLISLITGYDTDLNGIDENVIMIHKIIII